ncbi:MAG: hypothetical protein L0J54_02695 [Halomonas sp.]|nr:hypothetical protein [Halomonas sp.]MDN6296919.1 hypothetical protein [Halomonas sp.]MDN6314533.1 hypothetical protein [Halomonas sp.]MDN6336035.1 hypothetical protein [Halomonas sp.]
MGSLPMTPAGNPSSGDGGTDAAHFLWNYFPQKSCANVENVAFTSFKRLKESNFAAKKLERMMKMKEKGFSSESRKDA